MPLRLSRSLGEVTFYHTSMKKYTITCAVFLLFLLLLPAAVFGQETQEREKAGLVLGATDTVPVDILRFGSDITITDPVTRDLIAAGGTVIVGGEVEQDALVAGGTIIISEPVAKDVWAFGGTVQVAESVGGDVLVAGGTVTISGPVRGDVRVLGGDVTIASVISGNVAVAGGMVRFTKESSIAGSVAVNAGEVRLAGEIFGSLALRAQSVTMGGSVAGPIDATIVDPEQFMLGDGAGIGSSLPYSAPTQIEALDALAAPDGVVFRELELPKDQSGSVAWLFRVIGLFGMLVVGLVLVSLVPKPIRAAVEQSINRPMPDALWGLGTLVVVPLACVVLLLTIIGAPLAIIVLLLYGIGLYAARVITGIILGMYLFGFFQGKRGAKNGSLTAKMVIGVVALWLVCGIPEVGWVLSLLAVVWGLGIVVRMIRVGYEKTG